MKRTALLGLCLLSLLAFLPAAASAASPSVSWVRTHDSGIDDWAASGGVVVDKAGDIVVVGHEGMIADLRIIKYDTDGNEKWNRLFDGGGDDWATASGTVLIDSANNVVISGTTCGPAPDWLNSYFVVKYDADGNLLWSNVQYLGNYAWAWAASLDANDDVVLLGSAYNGADYDFMTMKFSSAGAFLWSQTFDSAADDWCGWGVDIDSANNILVTGSFFNGANTDICTIKYDPSGALVWAQAYDSGSKDGGFTVTVDSMDNVIVAGYFDNSVTSDVRLLKYNSAGALLWELSYDDGVNEYLYEVKTDSADRIVLACSSDNGLNKDYSVIKYTAGGSILWSKIYDGGTNERFWNLAIDARNYIVITGESINTVTGNADICTVMYDPGGGECWVATVDKGVDDYGTGVAIDQYANVIVLGSTFNGTDYDFYISKYDRIYVEAEQVFTKDVTGAWNAVVAPDDTVKVNLAITIHGNPAEEYSFQLRTFFVDALGTQSLMRSKTYGGYAPGTYYVAFDCTIPAAIATGKGEILNVVALGHADCVFDRKKTSCYVHYPSGSMLTAGSIDQVYTEDATPHWSAIFAPGDNLSVNLAVNIEGDPSKLYDFNIRTFLTDADGVESLLANRTYGGATPGTFYLSRDAVMPAAAASGRATLSHVLFVAEQGGPIAVRDRLVNYVNVE